MSAAVTPQLVPLNERAGFLPKHAGHDFLRYEMLTYALMERACEAYSGGHWQFYSLSNGGFFMALDTDEPLELIWPDNYFEGSMSAQAAGIAISLMVQSNLAFGPNGERMAQAFHKLRDYALDHAEASLIFRFID